MYSLGFQTGGFSKAEIIISLKRVLKRKYLKFEFETLQQRVGDGIQQKEIAL